MDRETKNQRTRKDQSPELARMNLLDPSSQALSDLPGTTELRDRQRMWRNTAMILLVGFCILGTLTLFRIIPQNGHAQTSPGTKFQDRLFRDWENPALAIVLSGQQDGYLQPCGCSSPQLGGLTRRYNFVQMLRNYKKWPVVAVDLGDLAQSKGPIGQRRLKYRMGMTALNMIGYSAIGVGKKEMDMPLLDALAEYTLQNNPVPRVLAANLGNREKGKVFDGLVFDSQFIQQPGLPSVAVVGLIGPSVQDKVNDPDLKFQKDNREVIKRALQPFRGKADLTVVLYQGSIEEAKACAEYCAQEKTLPLLDVILCHTDESEPSAVPMPVGKLSTQIVTIGHKGRYVGVVGVFPVRGTNQKFNLKYQLVPINPDFETPPGKEKNHSVMQLMEEYARLVKDANYVTKYPTSKHPMQVDYPQAKYVGSERCSGCHESAYAVWEKSGHTHAFQQLVEAKNPGFRQFDGECVVCHVVGFNHPSGYQDALRSGNQKMIGKLKDVGCESCHGPASEHVKDTHNEKIQAVMNPWKMPANATDAQKKDRLLKMDLFCMTCHDTDNDVHWDFNKKWPKIAHPSPRKGVQPIQGDGSTNQEGRLDRGELNRLLGNERSSVGFTRRTQDSESDHGYLMAVADLLSRRAKNARQD